MKKTTLSLIASLLACSTLFSATSWADPGEHGWQHGHGDKHHDDRRQDDRDHGDRHRGHGDRGGPRYEHHDQRDHFAWNGHDFRRGHAVAHEFRGYRYRIADWHERGLREPPRGQHWACVDGNYVLIAAATGIITALIMNNAFD